MLGERVTLWLTIAMGACLAVPAAASGKDEAWLPMGRTVIGDKPWTPPAPDAPKVIYGPDDRIDVYEESDPQRLAWTYSTVGLVQASRLQPAGDGTFDLTTSQWTVSSLPPCAGEPFADQPTAAFCTGFMIGPDLIATAGHCYNSSDLGSTRFVFGYWMLDEDTPVLNFSEDHIYHGIEIVSRALGGGLDHAIIRVDREITAPNAVPLPLRTEGVIPEGVNVGVIGHPAGLPMKIAFGDTTIVRDNSPASYFVANLDTYGGNSGSPVFNAETGIVEGILVRGAQDYVLQATCFVSNVFPDGGGGGEDSSKTTSFIDDLNALCAPSPHPAFDPCYQGVIALEPSCCEDEWTGACQDLYEATCNNCRTPQLAIPDNNPAGVSDTMAVSQQAIVANVRVYLNIAHSWVGDLVVTLEHVNSGTTVLLVERPGQVGDDFGCNAANFAGIVLDDGGAGGPIDAQCSTNLTSPPNYVPESPLGAFAGLEAASQWTLRVSDNAGADLGILQSWCLDFDFSAVLPDPPVILTNNGQDFSTDQQFVTLEGTTAADTAIIRVNGEPLASYTPGDTAWSVELDMFPKRFTNVIEVTAENGDGAESLPATITITFDDGAPFPPYPNGVPAAGTVALMLLAMALMALASLVMGADRLVRHRVPRDR